MFVCTLFLAALLPGAALAQTPDASTTAGEAGYGTLIASIQGADQELAELQALQGLALTDVRTVIVDDALAGKESPAVDHALEGSPEGVEALREFLNTTDIVIVGDDNVELSFRDVLGGRNAGVGDVVAVNVTGGQVILFVLEPSEPEASRPVPE